MRTLMIWSLSWLMRLALLLLRRAMPGCSPESRLLYVAAPNRRDSIVVHFKGCNPTTWLLLEVPLTSMDGPSIWSLPPSMLSGMSATPGNNGAADGTPVILSTLNFPEQQRRRES